jgi:hypothetical protein
MRSDFHHEKMIQGWELIMARRSKHNPFTYDLRSLPEERFSKYPLSPFREDRESTLEERKTHRRLAGEGKPSYLRRKREATIDKWFPDFNIQVFPLEALTPSVSRGDNLSQERLAELVSNRYSSILDPLRSNTVFRRSLHSYFNNTTNAAKIVKEYNSSRNQEMADALYALMNLELNGQTLWDLHKKYHDTNTLYVFVNIGSLEETFPTHRITPHALVHDMAEAFLADYDGIMRDNTPFLRCADARGTTAYPYIKFKDGGIETLISHDDITKKLEWRLTPYLPNAPITKRKGTLYRGEKAIRGFISERFLGLSDTNNPAELFCLYVQNNYHLTIDDFLWIGDPEYMEVAEKVTSDIIGREIDYINILCRANDPTLLDWKQKIVDNYNATFDKWMDQIWEDGIMMV